MSTSGVKDDNYKPDQNDDIVDGIFEFVEKSTLENLLSDVSASQDEYMVDLGDLESDRGDTAMSCPK